jgi:hypothetical protein
VLGVSVGSSTADCAAGVYPTVTLTNTSRQTVSWSANANDPSITIAPASGVLGAGTSATVTITGKTTAPDIIIIFTVRDVPSASGTNVAKIGCAGGKS